MEARKVTTRKGDIRFVPIVTEDEMFELMDCYEGFCVMCGAVRGCCEPDARQYLCESCGKRGVYGFQELLLMGILQLEEEDE